MAFVPDSADGPFREPVIESDEMGQLYLWGQMLEAGKEYSFDFSGELTPKSRRSLRTPSGKIKHSLIVGSQGVADSGTLRRTRTVEMWNPFGSNVDEPRPGLQ